MEFILGPTVYGTLWNFIEIYGNSSKLLLTVLNIVENFPRTSHSTGFPVTDFHSIHSATSTFLGLQMIHVRAKSGTQ